VKSVGIVTVGRSDFGVYRPILQRMLTESDLELRLYVSGMHLSQEHGYTVAEIEREGFPIEERIEMLLPSDTPESISKSVALGISGFAQLFATRPPDILLAMGDRFEMYAASLAALPFRIPVAHLGGGEITEGAFDDALRHSMTKLSHLHFVLSEECAARVRQLGEEAWRIHICGAPSLDSLHNMRLLTAAELRTRLNLPLTMPFQLVTYHPVTLEYEDTRSQIENLLKAIEETGLPVLFTAPNADTASRTIRASIESYVASHSDAWFIENLGTQNYFSVMAIADVMIGNSSSGLVEAPTFKLPVVNIGNRQKGRSRGANVIDAGYEPAAIGNAIRAALTPAFRESLRNLVNPYGTGNAAAIVVEELRAVRLNTRLTQKRFVHQPQLPGNSAAGSRHPDR
jgi:UDP-hydrolysing UDP-N-acetyl-D-glucosamine 2-epimerase